MSAAPARRLQAVVVEEPSAATAAPPPEGGHDLIAAWVKWMRVVRRFSPRTIDRRQSTIRQWLTYLEPVDWRYATAAQVEDFLSNYNAEATRRGYLGDLACLYKWAYGRSIVPADPAALVDRPREPKRLPRPWAEDDFGRALTEAIDVRVRLAIALAGLAGLRRAEIVALDARDLSLDTVPAMLVVRRGKGGKDRAVPVHPRLLAELRAFAPTVGPVVARHDGGKMTPNGLGDLVRQHMERLGLDGRLHGGRHRFGTEAARATHGDLPTVAALMGHASPNTTTGYVEISGARTAAAIDAMAGP